MPGWGLTKAQRDSKPWGLPPSVLRPGKVITDPVHGDIYLSWLEVAIVDTRPYQRLRRVRQLGTTHLVYPGATHTRFSHSLGTVASAQALLDQVLTQREGLHSVPDLFEQWEQAPEKMVAQVAEAVVLARLGALLHDLCHVPVGHTVEDDLRLLESHDENQERFQDLWGDIRNGVVARIAAGAVDNDHEAAAKRAKKVDDLLFSDTGKLFKSLRPLILSKVRDEQGQLKAVAPHEMEYPFVADLVGNTICADLLDYLTRDHLFAGLPAQLGHRFTSAFFVVPDGRGPLSRRMALNIQRQEHERPDVVSELLKALRYRYELSERALYHHAKLGADAMLGEALERWEAALWLKKASAAIERIPDHENRLERGDVYWLKAEMLSRDKNQAKDINATVRDDLEKIFRQHGDDGLLERMSALPETGDPDSSAGRTINRLLRHSSTLARALLDRDLFRIAGRIGFKDTSAGALFEAFGEAHMRDRLEREAERFAGLKDDDGSPLIEPRVVIWLPQPGMRLKLAQVLVQHNAGIGPFVEYEESRSGRGSDIYQAHNRLWSCIVFIRRDTSAEDEKEITTYLAGRMGVRWERHHEFGPRPADWTAELAIQRTFPAQPKIGVKRQRELITKLSGVSARGGDTFASICEKLVELEKSDS